MSFEPETTDIVIRQLKEEIAKIREEQFATALPTNEIGSASAFGGSSGTALPNIGTSASPPQRINATVDTGVIDLLNFDGKNMNKDFEIGETITGNSSGATAEVGDIDTLTSTTGTLTLVPSSIIGTFTDGENLNGSGAGGNNIAMVDGTLFTQIGRGHLNARATTIIVQGLTSTFELHFIDGAIANGQQIWIRPANGQTMIIRRPVTSDGNTGNIDFNETVSVGENQLLILQFHAESNVTPDGGWIPASNVSGGVASGSFGLPIIYDVDDKGDLNGLVSVSIDLSATTGHVTEVRLIEDVANPGVSISQTIGITGSPPDNKAIPFYLRVEQDSLGGHTIVLPATVFPVPTINTAPNSISTIMLFTSDNGVSFQSMRIIEQAGGGIDTPWTVDHDANTFDLFGIDKLRFFGAGGFSFPTDQNIQGISTAGAGLQLNVPLSQSYRFFHGGVESIRMEANDTFFNNKSIKEVGSIFFTDTPSFNAQIFPLGGLAELRYSTSGIGSHHAFFAENLLGFPQFEVRGNVVKSNVNLDLVTNDIINLDQAQFDPFGGFSSGVQHGERRISGGNPGMQFNVPNAKSFRLFIENIGLTDSVVEYEFDNQALRMNLNNIEEVTSIRHSQGALFADLFSELAIIGGRQGIATPDSEPQPIIFKSLEKTGFDTYVTRDIFTVDAREFFGGGGMKMHTDLNLQTQNINNVDVLKFIPDGGVIVGTEYAMGADFSDVAFNFNVPLDRDYIFSNNANPIAVLDPTGLQLFANPSFLNPQMGAREFSLNGAHTLGISGMLDGSLRLVDNAGSFDVMVGTGASVINLSTLASGGQTPWLSDIDANTFNLVNLDVLRFSVDGGVIGFSEYGISADAGDFAMNFSVPLNRGYNFQNNLDPIAFLNHTGLNLLANAQFADPAVIAREYIALSHSVGTSGLGDGAWRLVGGDVIFGSGGGLINLTTLSGGGGDNLGNHIMTQALNNSNFGHSNWVGWTAGVGQTFDVGAGGDTWNLQSGDSYQWRLNGGTKMVLTEFVLGMQGLRIENVADPVAFLDVANKQYVDAQVGGGAPSTWSQFPATQAVNMANFGFSNFVGWTGGIGQALAVSGLGAVFDMNVGDFYNFRIGGASIATITGGAFGVLSMNTHRIENVVNPVAPQDVATKDYVDTAGGGSPSTWSQFPATQNVDISGFQLVNTVAINGLGDGGGLVWGAPNFGTSLLADTLGMDIRLADGTDSLDIFYGGLARQFFTSSVVIFDSFLNMQNHRIVSVADPLASQDVVTKAFGDANYLGGGTNLLPLNNVWTGINTFTGLIHNINSSIINIGDSFLDTVNMIGTTTFNNDVDMQAFRITSLDFPVNPTDGANKAYVDGVLGPGLLGSNNLWTGTNTWTNTFSVNSSLIFIGDSQSDRVFNVADQDFSLTPRSNNDIDLGNSGSRWRDAFIDNIFMNDFGGQLIVNALAGFNSFVNFRDDVLVDGGGDLIVDDGGDLIVDNPGFILAQGDMFAQDLFFHSGSQLGFYGAGLTTRGTVFDLAGTASLLQVIGAFNQLVFELEDTGIINVI